ncbi:MAG: hypothetical protein JSV04_01660, partial [Candidatus Heimdallarchaeota archaeon]
MESNQILRTGVQSLDIFLGGEDNPGLPEKSVILVLGEPGTKFELFTQQVLYRLLQTKATEKVVYLSYDGRPHEIVEEMAIYDFKLQPFIMAGEKWQFMDAFTARIAAEGAVIGLQSLPGVDFGTEFAQDSLRFFSRVFIPT